MPNPNPNDLLNMMDEVTTEVVSETPKQEQVQATKKNAPATKAKPTKTKPTKTKEKDNPNGSVTENRMVNQSEKGLDYSNLPLGENGVEVKADKRKTQAEHFADAKKKVTADMAGVHEAENAQLAKQSEAERKLNDATAHMGRMLKLPEAPKEEAVEDFDDGVYRVTTPIGRYNYRIQHGWSIPSLDQDYLEFAKEENGMAKGYSNSQMKAMQNKNKAEMSDRAKQMALNRDRQAWKDLQTRIERGGFDDLPGRQRNVDAIIEARRKIAQDYVMNGGNVDEEGNPLGLYDMGENMSGFKASSRLAQNFANNMERLETSLYQLEDDLKHETFGTSAKKGQYDASINDIQKILSGASSGVQADAEKQRIQYLYLPDEMQEEYQKEFQKYLDTLRKIANDAHSDKALNAINANIKILANGSNEALRGDSLEAKGAGAYATARAINGIEAGFSDLPTQLEAVKLAWEAFNENINKIAIIDPNVLYNQLMLARKISRRQYERTVKEAGGIPTLDTWGGMDELGKDWKDPNKYRMGKLGTVKTGGYEPIDTGSNLYTRGVGNYGK